MYLRKVGGSTRHLCYYTLVPYDHPSSVYYLEWAQVRNPEIWIRYANGQTAFERYDNEVCSNAGSNMNWDWQYNRLYYYGDQVYRHNTTWRMIYGGNSGYVEPGYNIGVWKNIDC